MTAAFTFHGSVTLLALRGDSHLERTQLVRLLTALCSAREVSVSYDATPDGTFHILWTRLNKCQADS